MAITIKRLIRDMDRLALATWSKIELSDQVGLRFGEESITDHDLLTLALGHPDPIVHRYS